MLNAIPLSNGNSSKSLSINGCQLVLHLQTSSTRVVVLLGIRPTDSAERSSPVS